MECGVKRGTRVDLDGEVRSGFSWRTGSGRQERTGSAWTRGAQRDPSLESDLPPSAPLDRTSPTTRYFSSSRLKVEEGHDSWALLVGSPQEGAVRPGRHRVGLPSGSCQRGSLECVLARGWRREADLWPDCFQQNQKPEHRYPLLLHFQRKQIFGLSLFFCFCLFFKEKESDPSKQKHFRNDFLFLSYLSDSFSFSSLWRMNLTSRLLLLSHS